MPAPAVTDRYPWYDVVSGRELQQGDILLQCPMLDMPLTAVEDSVAAEVRVLKQDAIILTQSCDLALRNDGKCEVEQVALCPIYRQEELRDDPVYGHLNGWEEARKGRHFAYHVLNKSDLPERSFGYLLVDLGDLFSLPVGLVRDLAQTQEPRARLNPPYREHFAQAFARFFMRVGLPVDIPKFTR